MLSYKYEKNNNLIFIFGVSNFLSRLKFVAIKNERRFSSGTVTLFDTRRRV